MKIAMEKLTGSSLSLKPLFMLNISYLKWILESLIRENKQTIFKTLFNLASHYHVAAIAKT